MTYKISILGRPSVGKTTTMHFLVNQFKNSHVQFIPEIAREYIIKNGGIKNIQDQLIVAKTQSHVEKTALEKEPDILLTEAPVFNALPYAKTYFCHNENDYSTYCEIVRISAQHSYDLILWCNSTGSYIEDGVRYQKESELSYLEREIKENLYMFHKGNIISLPRSIKEREKLLKIIVKQIEKGEYNVKKEN